MDELDDKKRLMIECLQKSMGIISTACKAANIVRQTHYNWLESDPIYAKAVKDIEEGTIDFAESQLHKKIKKEDITAIIFYMKTKGKKRGYIERQETEISGPGGGQIVLQIDDNCKPIEGL